MLTFDELRKKNIARCETGFGHTLASWSVAEWGCATAGECGEACNVAKKMLRFRDNVAGNKKSYEEYRADLASEIAGMVVYADLWAAAAGINLEQAVRDEFNKKSVEIGSEITIPVPGRGYYDLSLYEQHRAQSQPATASPSRSPEPEALAAGRATDDEGEFHQPWPESSKPK
jgi:hypothetical protein